jgi:hypothetical protein
MTELIIKNDIGKKKMKGLLLFLKSWDIEAEIISVAKKSNVKKVGIVNRPDITENERVLASQRDNEIFFEAVFQQTQPNDALVEVVNMYKQILSE